MIKDANDFVRVDVHDNVAFTNVNISNEFKFCDVNGSVNYIGSLAKYTRTPSGFIHFERDPIQFTLR